MTYSLLNAMPIWTNWVLFLLVLAASVEIGYHTGFRRRKRCPDAEIGGGGVVLSAMVALLGLILAFTYSASTNRHEQRKQAVIVEANALGTAFLRAETIAEPERSELRSALYRYAQTRFVDDSIATNLNTQEGLQQLLDRSNIALAELWPLTTAVINEQGRDPITAALMASINEVIDMHTVRIAAVRDRLPSIVVAMLLFIAGAALAVTGFHAGVSGVISRWRLSLLALVLTSIMIVIVDLDRPRDGMVKVGQTSLAELIAEMNQALN